MLLSIFRSLLLVAVASADVSIRQEKLKGDRFCSSTVCVEATVNGTSTVDYVVSSTGGMRDVGWIGIGFGDSMVNTPLVVMWTNPDGTMTLSQRETSYHSMPKVDDEPDFIATPYPALSTLTGSKPKFAFSVPLNGRKGAQKHVYAISEASPASSAVDAIIGVHDDNGHFRINFDKVLTPSAQTEAKPEPVKSTTTPHKTSPPRPHPTGTRDHIPTADMPYTPHQRLILAHALFGFAGFLVCLPLSAILSRWLRTWTPAWVQIHWVIQTVIAGPLILMSVILGVRAVSKSGALHFDDSHKKWGFLLLFLYIGQLFFGAFVHLVKSKAVRKPVRNHVHAIVGLIIVALSFVQVRSGYNHEWKIATGRAPLPASTNSVYWSWLAIVVFSYVGGLFMLKRQFLQEREAKAFGNEGGVDMEERESLVAH